MRRHRVILVFVVFALIAATAPAIGQQTGSISGTIVDADTGEAIAGVPVFVDGPGLFAGPEYTSIDGSYAFLGLPQGSYLIFAGNEMGPEPEASDWIGSYWPGVSDYGDALAVSVGPAEQVTGIDLALEFGGVLSGYVTDAWTGEPVGTDAQMDISLDIWLDGRWIGRGGWVEVENDGSYRIGGLSGRYRLTTSSTAYLPVESEFAIEPGEELTLDLTVTPAYGTPFATVSGVVCEVVGSATGCSSTGPALLAGIAVEARTSDGTLLGEAVSDEWGGFFIENLTPGTIVVSAVPPSGMTLVSEMEYTLGPNEYAFAELMARRIDAHLVLHSRVDPLEVAPGDEVRLRLETVFASVAGSTSPFDVSGVVVAVHVPPGLAYLTHSGDGPYDATNGLWSIPSLPFLGRASMTLTLLAEREGVFQPNAEIVASDWPDSRSTFGDGRGADFASSTLNVVTPTPVVVDEAVIGGVVWLDSNGDGINDNDEAGLEGITLTVTRDDGSLMSSVTALDGSYRVEGLAAGTYEVSIDRESLPEDVDAPGASLVIALGPDTAFLEADFACTETASPLGWWLIGGAFLVLGGGAWLAFWLLTQRRRDADSGDLQAQPESLNV